MMLPQGATNSIGQFVKIINTVLHDWIPDDAQPFLDNIRVKGPRTKYGGEEVAPGVCRFVLEHIQAIDRTLADLERAGLTIAGAKSQFCMPGIKIVGFICDEHGRHPDSSKIVKIIKWPLPVNATEARVFIRVCVYYQIWVKDFTIVAAPIFTLFKKNHRFL